MKRKSAVEIFKIQKRVREVAGGEAPFRDPSGSPSPPSFPNETESSTVRIRREAVKEFKGSPEFRDLVDVVGAQAFVKGFYACRNWINYHMPQLDLRDFTFSIVPLNLRYPLHNYLTEAENVVAAQEEEAREEEANEDDEEAEEDMVELAVDDEDVKENQSSDEEKD